MYTCQKCGKNWKDEVARTKEYICSNHDEDDQVCGGSLVPDTAATPALPTPTHPTAPILTGPKSSWPAPLALLWAEFITETDPLIRLWAAADFIEMLLRLFVVIRIAELAGAQASLPQTVTNKASPLIETPTMGKWRRLTEDLSAADPDSLIIPELRTFFSDILRPFLDGPSGAPTPESSFISLRNLLAHGGGMTRCAAQRLLGIWTPRIEKIAEALGFVAEISLLVRSGSSWLRLRGAHIEPESYKETALLTDITGAHQMAVICGDKVLGLFPLMDLGIAIAPGNLTSDEPEKHRPLVYIRSEGAGLYYNAIGSETAPISVGGKEAWSVFRALFRLDERKQETKDWAIEGFEQELARDAAQLCGRGKDLERLGELASGNTGIVWMTGEPGIGKSFLMAAFATERLERQKQGDGSILVLAYRFKASDSRCTGFSFLRFLAERLSDFTKLKVKEKQDDRNTIRSAIQALGDRSVLVLVDGIDEVMERESDFLDKKLLPLCKAGLRWILAGRPEPELEAAMTEAGAIPAFRDGLPGLDGAGIREMILEKIGPLRKRLLALDHDNADKTAITNAFIEKVTTAAQGLPLYVKYLVGDILSRKLTPDPGICVPPSLADYYDELLKRLGVGDIQSILAPVVAVLAVAREALPPEVILAFLNRVIRQDADGLELVNLAITHLAGMVRRSVTSDGKEAWKLYHHSLARHILEARDMEHTVWMTKERILERCAAMPPREAAASPYLYRHGPAHLLKAGKIKELQKLMGSFEYWLELLRTLGDPEGPAVTLGHWQTARSSKVIPEDLRIHESFFQSKAHILRRGNTEWPSYKILLQLALEHADDSPVTRSAEDWLAKGICDWAWIRRERRVATAGIDPCIAVFEGHTVPVDGALVLRDKNILSWSTDTTLRIWDSRGKQLLALEGHTGRVIGALVLPDGNILSWSSDETLRIWDHLGNPQGLLEGHDLEVRGALVLSDENILSWSEDSTLRIWDSLGNPQGLLEGHESGVRGALVLPDGAILSWSEDSTLRIWDSQGRAGEVLRGHTGLVGGAMVLSDGTILSWSHDNTLRIWDLEGKALVTLEGHTGPVLGALVLSDVTILSWSLDSTLRIWDLEGQALATLEGHTKPVLGALVLSDGNILSWSEDSTLRRWDSRGKFIISFEGHKEAVRGASVLSVLPGDRILSWSDDKTLRTWDSIGNPLAILHGHSSQITGVVAYPNECILSWSKDTTLCLWNPQGETMTVPEGHKKPVQGVTRLSNERILSWSEDWTLRIWDSIGNPLAILEGHTERITGAQELPGDKILSWSIKNATEPFMHSLHLWDSRGRVLGVFEGHMEPVQGTVRLPEERILRMSAGDSTLRIWDSIADPLAILLGHAEGVNTALVLPDGSILSWSEDTRLYLSSPQGKTIASFDGHEGAVLGALPLPDGNILSWSRDKTLRLWDSLGNVLEVLQGHEEFAQEVFVLPDGNILSWSSKDTRLWDLHGKSLGFFDHPDGLRKFPELTPEALRLQGLSLLDLCPALNQASTRIQLWNHKALTGPYWQATYACQPRLLFPDGRMVVTQDDGQVCFLQLYRGNKPVSIPEA